MPNFDSVKEYQPQKMDAGFEVIKERNLSCGVDYCRREPYGGDNEELRNTEWVVYCLTVLTPPQHIGRKLWKRFNIDTDEGMRKLADVLWTVGLTFKTSEQLDQALTAFTALTLKVRAWPWTPREGEEPVQMHQIKGMAKEPETVGKIPF